MKRQEIIWNGLTLIIVLAALFLWSIYRSMWSEQDQFGESHSYVDKVGEMEANRVMPRKSTNIKYVFRDSGFGYSLGYRCDVDEESFMEFTRDKGMIVTNALPRGLSHDFFFFDVYDTPSQFYFAESTPGRANGLKLIYLSQWSILIGQYNSL